MNVIADLGEGWKLFTMPAPDDPNDTLVGIIGNGMGARKLLQFLTGANPDHADIIVVGGHQAVVTRRNAVTLKYLEAAKEYIDKLLIQSPRRVE